MNYPIYVSDYINIDFAVTLILLAILAMALIALWFDLSYKPKVYELTTLLNRKVYSAIGESINRAHWVTFTNQSSILSREEYELKYSPENQAKAIEESLINNPYKLKQGFEYPKSVWVNTAFQAVKNSENFKKQVKVPYRVFPVEKLLIEESMKISVGSIELEKVMHE